jgi:NADPH:quinone reductase-like Zn-dependent oxidoreductase
METACINRRVISGGYAEYAAIPAEALVPIPDKLGFSEACMLGSSTAVALNALRDIGRVRLGDWVLVTGASGGVGLPAIEIAKAAGAKVIAVTRSSAKSAALAAANHVVVAADGHDFSDQVVSLTEGAGVDIVVDTVGSRVFTPSFKSLAAGGRYLVIGQLFREEVSINLARILFKSAAIIGVTNARRDQLVDTVRLVTEGAIHPRVAAVLPLAEAARAHALVEAGDVIGRIVLTP